jgi:hypothetical protein
MAGWNFVRGLPLRLLLTLLIAVSCEVAFAAAVAEVAEPRRAIPLDILSPFAGLAAAVAIAYAALPNFRYRKRVRRHVRRTLKKEKLLDFLHLPDNKPNPHLCSHDSWGVLYRLGHLGYLVTDKKVPVPMQADKTIAVDHNFASTLPYMCYSGIFASNLDKWTTIVLGVIAGSTIWFAAIDNIQFHDVAVNDAARMAYLTTLRVVYLLICWLMLSVFVLHILLWRWAAPLPSKKHNYIAITARAVASVMVFMMFMVSVGEADSYIYLASSKFGSWGQQHIFFLFKALLLIATGVPFLFLLAGEYLTRRMIQESNQSFKTLLNQITAQPAEATFTPAA